MKIPQENIKRSYELTCMVEPELTKAETEEITGSIQEIIIKNKGKVASSEEWGKKDMAYVIKKAGKKYIQANYLHFVFEADPADADQIKNVINITDSVIRYLLVKQED